VHLACGDRIETRRRLVEEHDLRVAQQHSRQSHPLFQSLRQSSAQISGPIAEVDGVKGVSDPRPCPMQSVEAGEVLEVLGHGQPQIEAW
jgi:hypothetical protein